jgi:hypothetical protein
VVVYDGVIVGEYTADLIVEDHEATTARAITPPIPSRTSRNQKAKVTSSAVRANLDDPPVHSSSFNRNGFLTESVKSQAIRD